MKHPTALLIEDEALPRQRLREGLAELWPQLQVLAEAEDGERGLGLVLELRPDIVFVDIRLPGRSLATVRRAAIGLRRGGVGYYPHAQFVHLDVGRVRYW